MTPDKQHLIVTIAKHGPRNWAVSEDGVRCNIEPGGPDYSLGDRWNAEAVRGRVRGEKGLSTVKLLKKLSQGFVTEVDGHWMDPKTLEQLQVYFEAGLNPLLTGPPATGKTTFAQRFTTARGWKLLMVDCSTVLTARDFFGSDAVHAGATLFLPSELTSFLEREGNDDSSTNALVLFDEINRAQGKVANGLLHLLGPYRRTVITTVAGPRTIKFARNIAAMATANMGREYSGTFELDAALSDRLQPVRVTPPPLDAAVKLHRVKFGSIAEGEIRTIVSAGQILREQFQQRRSIKRPPTFRGTEAALALRGRSWTVKDAILSGYLGGMTEREQADLWGALRLQLPELPPLVEEASLHRK